MEERTQPRSLETWYGLLFDRGVRFPSTSLPLIIQCLQLYEFQHWGLSGSLERRDTVFGLDPATQCYWMVFLRKESPLMSEIRDGISLSRRPQAHFQADRCLEWQTAATGAFLSKRNVYGTQVIHFAAAILSEVRPSE